MKHLRQFAIAAAVALCGPAQAASIAFVTDPIVYDQRVTCRGFSFCSPAPDSIEVVYSGIIDIPDPLSDFSGLVNPTEAKAGVVGLPIAGFTAVDGIAFITYTAPTNFGGLGSLSFSNWNPSASGELIPGVTVTTSANPAQATVSLFGLPGNPLIQYQRSGGGPVLANISFIAPIPVPATAPLLAAGLGLGFVALRRRGRG